MPRIGSGLKLGASGVPRKPKPSLSDSSASRASWNMSSPNGEDVYPHIAGARSKVPETSVEMKRPSVDNGDVVNRTFIGKIGHGFRSLWSTRFTEDSKESDVLIKTTLRELIVYVVFIILLCVMTFGMASTNMYYFNNLMNNIFVQNSPSDKPAFQSIGVMEDLWNFLSPDGPLVTYAYPDQWYNSQNYTNTELGYVLHENRLLGAIRMRQLRVSNSSCIIPDDFKEYIQNCYDNYDPGVEDKHPFGLQNGTAWTYQNDKNLVTIGSGFSGQVASYGMGGYIQDLPTTANEVNEVIATLQSNLWIDRGTRAVFIDFTVYNANINLFCIVRLVAELPATGGVIPSYELRTVKLLRYVTGADYFVMACEIFIAIFLVYYTIEEILEIRKHRLQYLKGFWNILDLVMLAIAFFCMVFNVYRTVAVGNSMEKLLKNPDEFADFSFLSYWQIVFNSSLAVLVFCAWVKIFKYISFNKTMTQLSSTLSKCAKDLAGFAVMFFIFFLAFAQLGYLLFGSQVQSYSSIEQSVFSLFRTILGDFDFDALQQANRVLGPAFFILYVFFVFFILLNMFLAIINDTYSEVKSDLADQKNEFEMGDYFKKGAFKMLEKMNIKKEKLADINGAMCFGDANGDGTLDFEEWRLQMKQRGYADAEIEAVFAKYDINGDRTLDKNEQQKMQIDLSNQEAALDREYQQINEESRVPVEGISREEVTSLKQRVVGVERSVEGVLSKVDSVLSRLEFNEKSQGKRREVLTKLLDPIIQSGAMPDDESRQELIRLIRDELIHDNNVGRLS